MVRLTCLLVAFLDLVLVFICVVCCLLVVFIGCLYWLDSVLVCGVVFGLRLGLVWVCVLVGVGFSWLVLGFVCRDLLCVVMVDFWLVLV